jgi:hypothetical protein
MHRIERVQFKMSLFLILIDEASSTTLARFGFLLASAQPDSK